MADTNSRVLEGIERIHWMTTAVVCFPGALAASMRFLGEDMSGDMAMGVTGGAFKTFWRDPWNDCNCDLLILGEEPIRRGFAARGYGYTFVDDFERSRPREFYRDAIVRSIDAGRPVIALGVVGPPEASIVAGYEDGGDVLVGTSYVHAGDGYFRTADWYENTYGLILVGEKEAAPAPEKVLRDALEWAVTLARKPSFLAHTPPQPYANGLSAYDAFAAALLRDEDFPARDADTLRHRLIPISNDGICLQHAKREAAARFLDGMAEKSLPGAEELRAAAALYREQVAVLGEAMDGLPYNGSSEEQVLRIADPDLRRTLSGYLCRAKALEERSVERLEAALAHMKA